jgi:hypothetical protein
MKYLKEKIKAGVISLENMSIENLIQLSNECESWQDRDMIGCEIMYRS